MRWRLPASAARRPLILASASVSSARGGELGGEGLGGGDADLGAGGGDEAQRGFSRTMADSGTLQIARVLVMPSALACLSAARVSAVSPDWEMTTTRVSGSGTDSR